MWEQKLSGLGQTEGKRSWVRPTALAKLSMEKDIEIFNEVCSLIKKLEPYRRCVRSPSCKLFRIF